LVVVANMEAEDDWNAGRPGLPAIAGGRRGDIVRRMDELGVWLASEHDVVVVSKEPDPAFVRYLRDRGLFEGRLTWVAPEERVASLLAGSDLARRVASGAALLPMGNTKPIEELAAALSIPVAAPAIALSARVNAKTYSQELCDRLEVPRPKSFSSHSLRELRARLADIFRDVSKVCVKESLGVSGRGIVTLDSPAAGDRLLRMLSKQHGEDDLIDFVVEEWIENALDLNYQLLVDEAGEVKVLGLRSSEVIRGVHQGHRYPVPPEATHHEGLTQHGRSIASALGDEGYFGVVGLDALSTPEGQLFPCLEINARLNMSTFQNRIIDEHVPQNGAAQFFFVRPPAAAPDDFSWYETRLRTVLLRRGDERGVIVMAHATVASRGGDRRLYLATVGRDHKDAQMLRDLVADLLEIS